MAFAQESTRLKTGARGGVGCRVLAALCTAVGLNLLPLPSSAQSASFVVQHSETQSIVYQSQSYRSMLEAVIGMYSYVRQQYAAGSRVAVWYYSHGVSPREIAFRVPPVDPVSYKSTLAFAPGSTPQAACQEIIASHPKAVLKRVYLDAIGTGLGQWVCEVDMAAVPEAECFPNTPCIWQSRLLESCEPTLTKVRNDDRNGQAMCGLFLLSRVSSIDVTPDKPDDECEGNPIVPSSAQKTHNETDYDDGRFLQFARNYGSQRFSPVPGGFSPWSYSYSELLTTAPQEYAGAAVRGDGTVARISSDGFTGAIRPVESDMPYSGNVSLVNGVAVGYTIYSPFAPYVDLYDGSGNLLRRTNADGSYQVLTYSSGLAVYPATAPACVASTATPPARLALQCVTDPFGRQLTFEWNAAGFRSKLIDPAGGVIQFAFDGSTSYYDPAVRGPVGNLTSVTRQDGSVRLYHYNEPANVAGVDQYSMLTGISDQVEDGSFTRYATYKYDAGGLAVSTEHAGGAGRYAVSYAYAGNTFQTTVIRPLGANFVNNYTKVQSAWRKTSTAQPPGSGSLACSDSKSYDTHGNITARINFNGNKTCYAYDVARKLEIKRVEGVDGVVECSTALSSPPAGARVITTEWHPTWPLRTRIAEPNKVTALVYNGQNASCAPGSVLVDGKPAAVVCSRTEQATTDDTGATGFGAGLDGPARTWAYTYAAYGRVLTATDPNGKTAITTYYPDDDPNLGRRGNVATRTNAAGHVTRYTAYNLHGQPTQIIDANGLVTEFAYDARMRLTSRKVGGQLTTLTYTPFGKLKTMTLPDGSGLTHTYDAAQRLVAVRDHKLNRVEYTLDAMGNSIVERASDPNGVLEKNVQRTIDVLNRVQQVVGLQ